MTQNSQTYFITIIITPPALLTESKGELYRGFFVVYSDIEIRRNSHILTRTTARKSQTGCVSTFVKNYT